MERLKYQFILTLKDKMVIISLLLPIIMAFLVNSLANSDFTTAIELKFGAVDNNLPDTAIINLQAWGEFKTYENEKTLYDAIQDPSSEIIGFFLENNKLEAILSGDETALTKDIATKLPSLLSETSNKNIYINTILERENIFDVFKIPLIAMTIITAIYMGCVFNTMNIITEKEDGITIINEILPMDQLQYLCQKSLIGFTGGVITAIITMFICLPPKSVSMFLMVLLVIILSSYIAAIIGLFIGDISESVLIGMVYLKVILLLFIATPFAAYMLIEGNSFSKILTFIIPSCISFDAIVALKNNSFTLSNYLILGLVFYAIILTIIFSLSRKIKHSPKLLSR